MNQDVEVIVRLLLASVLGGAVGWERERMNRAAGLRTHVLVAVGSALFTILSVTSFLNLGKVNDPARVAAQIVSGIGFLGAGAIMKNGATVRGLTTAATLWVVAAIGMAVGAGAYIGATSACVIVLLVLTKLRPLEHSITDMYTHHLRLTTDLQPGHLTSVREVFEACNAKVVKFDAIEDDEHFVVDAVIAAPAQMDKIIICELQELGIEVTEIFS